MQFNVQLMLLIDAPGEEIITALMEAYKFLKLFFFVVRITI